MNDTGGGIDILLVEDNPGDVRLTEEALREAKVRNRLYHVADGIEAMAFLRGEGVYEGYPKPDLVLLDLNLPRKSGREVLEEVKADENLRRIPIVILTTSQAEEDIIRSYDLHANCYISKPVNFDEFMRVIRSIEDFWLAVVRLPPH